jgi:hypothetical protein
MGQFTSRPQTQKTKTAEVSQGFIKFLHQGESFMDEKFDRYLVSHTRWTKFFCDTAILFFALVLADFLLGFYLSLASCIALEREFLAKAASSYEYLDDFPYASCVIQNRLWLISIVLLIFILIRIPFLMFSRWPILKLSGLILVRIDDKNWTPVTGLKYGLIDGLLIILGFFYLLLFGSPTTLFDMWVIITVFVLVDVIWRLPLGFGLDDKSLLEKISGVTVDVTEKKLNQIQKSYQNRFKRKFFHFFYNFYVGLIILSVGFFIFSFIQILRTPALNPAYNEALYGGIEPVWENNSYFAMEGVSAPEGVSDFYQYGLKKAAQNATFFSLLQERSGIDKKYIHDVPDLMDLPITIDESQALKINDSDWKNLDCLYDIHEQKNEECASFSDWKEYIQQNKIMWDRFNRVPDFGDVFEPTPQLIGGRITNIIPLAELKAAHIIYLAENGRTRMAMYEWARFMDLYREMAASRGGFIFKAMIAVIINQHYKALEKLLYNAPDLGKIYKAETIEVLKNDGPIFRDPYMLSDDLGYIEPIIPYFGNLNAIKNDFYECIVGFKALAETPHDVFPFTNNNIVVCPMHEEKGALEEFVFYPIIKSGHFIPNATYALILGGMLKGHELIENFKIMQVRFRLAQLGVQILSNEITASEVESYIKSVPASLQNPITLQPFEWDNANQSVYFDHPDGNTRYEFRLNLKDN